MLIRKYMIPRIHTIVNSKILITFYTQIEIRYNGDGSLYLRRFWAKLQYNVLYRLYILPFLI